MMLVAAALAGMLAGCGYRNIPALPIDNGLAFSGMFNPIAAIGADWGEIRVSALARMTVDRLRAMAPRAFWALGVAAQFEKRDGMLVPVAVTDNLDRDEGVRSVGVVVQLGLTKSEIEGMLTRRAALLEKVDAGKLRVF